MSVVIETTLGDITVDLYLYDRPRACLNFLKLCKIKYYNYNLFHTISRDFIAQTGDPTGTRSGGKSIFGVTEGSSKSYFEAENEPRIKHTRPGLISFVGDENHMIGSQFFVTLGDDLTYLDEKHCVFGQVVEGFDILEIINEVICDNDDRPYQDVRITHTVVLDDPYPDPKGLEIPSRSPSPSAERLAGGRIAPDEEVDETSGKSAKEVVEMQAEREAKARATILEMVGDIPDADMAPPENVLFVCKLNPLTNDDDLEIVFSRFGKIKSCEVIKDRKTGDSLQYAFIEFEDKKSCEDAYFKMNNVLIDDRRLHVDFSQSVSKVKWLGKGRGVKHLNEKGNRGKPDVDNAIGRGDYKISNGSRNENIDRQKNRKRSNSPRTYKERSNSPRRKKSSQSPERSRRESRSPQLKKRQSRSPKARQQQSRTPVRRSRSPVKRKRYSRSPERSPRRTDKNYSPKRQPTSPLYNRNASRKNFKRYSPERKFNLSRPRYWRTDGSSSQNRRNNFSERLPRSSRKRSRSPRKKSNSPRRSRTPRKKNKSPSWRSKSRSRGSSSPEVDSRYRLLREKPDMPMSSEKRSHKERQPKSPSRSDALRKETNKHNGSPRKSRSPRRSESPIDQSEKMSKYKQGDYRLSKQHTSQSPRRSISKHIEKDIRSETHKNRESKKSVSEDSSGKERKLVKQRLSSESKISKDKTKKTDKRKSNSEGKKSKSNSKSKKSKKYDSSEESETDSEKDRKKSKKNKPKKIVESSSDSSSSESSSSSEEEAIVKKKATKRKAKKDNKKKKNKKTKRRKSSSSSSSDSSSDSESDSSSSSDNSSSSGSENKSYKKKKTKKKRTKSSSESD